MTIIDCRFSVLLVSWICSQIKKIFLLLWIDFTLRGDGHDNKSNKISCKVYFKLELYSTAYFIGHDVVVQ